MKNEIEIVDTEFGQAVYLGSDIEFVMNYATQNKIKGLIISYDRGFRNTTIEFLKNYTFIENLIIQYYGNIDLNGIHYLRNLKKLALNIIANDNQLIDFSCFPNLETCFFDWRPKAKSIFNCKTLKDLRISKFRKENLEDLQELSNLEALTITSSPIKYLKGIENLKISRLRLYYLTKLENLNYIEGLAEYIKELDIHACKKIKNIQQIASLTNLEMLGLNNCGEIDNIKPIKNLKKLYRFNFRESTNILDGDVTPCFDLKDVAFQNRKHYTHTYEEINKVINKKPAANKQ